MHAYVEVEGIWLFCSGSLVELERTTAVFNIHIHAL